MRLQQELHDAQAGFGAHGREHIRVTGDLVGGELAGHISIIAEIWDAVKWLLACGFWRTENRLAGVTATRGAAVCGGNVYLSLVRSKQQRGLSTTFGWRLTPLKMTDMWGVRACRVRRSRLISAWRESRQLAPRRSMVEMYIYSREIQAAAGSFDYVRLAPHSAQDDRHVGCERVQGVRRSINFRRRESRQLAPRRSLVEMYIC